MPLDVIIVGGGIGGLTTALALHAQGLDARIRVFEAAPEIKPLGVGINIQPHAGRELTRLGLRPALAAVGIETKERAFFTHHGQLVFREPAGIYAGYPFPQFSIHRGDLLMVLYKAAAERIGAENIICGHRCVSVEQTDDRVTVHFRDPADKPLDDASGDLVIAADGIHSQVRKQFHPHEGPPRYHGINMWRGVTRSKPFLSGGTSVRVGGLFATGKMVIYPIRNDIDGAGTQLINWNVDVASQTQGPIDWGKEGRLEDFFHLVKDWHFDWLDAPDLIRNAEFIYSFPMVDRDPIDRWVFGRAMLLGDAAHPMFPRGGNGGASAILDAVAIARLLAAGGAVTQILKAFESERLSVVNRIVEENRARPPDVLIDIVEKRTNGQRFENLNDVISESELREISESYKRVASSDLASVTA